MQINDSRCFAFRFFLSLLFVQKEERAKKNELLNYDIGRSVSITAHRAS